MPIARPNFSNNTTRPTIDNMQMSMTLKHIPRVFYLNPPTPTKNNVIDFGNNFNSDNSGLNTPSVRKYFYHTRYFQNT